MLFEQSFVLRHRENREKKKGGHDTTSLGKSSTTFSSGVEVLIIALFVIDLFFPTLVKGFQSFKKFVDVSKCYFTLQRSTFCNIL